MLKKIEIAFRRLLLRYLAASNKASSNRTIDTSKLKRVLLLRQDRLGDLVISVSLIKELKRKLPESCKIGIVLGKKNISGKWLIEGLVDNTYPFGKDLKSSLSVINKIRKEKYDLVVDLLDNPSSSSALLTRLSNATNSLGFEKKYSEVYSHTINLPDKTQSHIIDRIFSIPQYLLHYHTESDFRKISIDITEDDIANAKNKLSRFGDNIIAINVSGSTRNKYLGRKNIIELCCHLRLEFPQCEILLFGIGEYYKEIDLIIEEVKKRNYAVHKAPASNNFKEYSALLSLCSLAINPDTSAVHLCSAFQIPQLVLYSYVPDNGMPMPWYPYMSPYLHINVDGALAKVSIDLLKEKASELVETYSNFKKQNE
ncbi:MAG: hypothetical protein Kapaf2KO_19070 [Candidatus Kapaibacteriales bacterium]